MSRLPQQQALLARSKRRNGLKEKVYRSPTRKPYFLHHILRTVLTLHSPNLVKDKANHAVILDKATSDKLYKDVQSYRLITVATLVDRLKINGSLARKALKDLEEKGQIKKVVGHSKLSIYSKYCMEFFFHFILSSCLDIGRQVANARTEETKAAQKIVECFRSRAES